MEQINSVLQGDKLWLRKSHGKPVEESETDFTGESNSIKKQASICSTLFRIGEKSTLLNTQHKIINHVLTTKDTLWCVSYRKQKVFKLVYFFPR